MSLDDPFTIRRFTAEEVAHWRDLGVHCFVPCVSKEGTIAVMALGGKESGEPLNSEDMGLLEAVAGQVATAFENGRLYHQLQRKAAELDRERGFNENIIESLDDGLLVAGLDDRVVRWNPALERIYGVPRAEAVGRRLDELFDGVFLAPCARTAHAAAGQPTNVTMLYRVPLVSRHAEGGASCSSTSRPRRCATPTARTAGTIVMLEDITSRVQLEEQLQISEKMASIGLLAAGVAHEVNTPLTGISSFTQMLLEGADPDDPRTKLLEKIERQTFRAAKIVNGLLNLARPAQVERRRSICTRSSTTCCRCSSTSSARRTSRCGRISPTEAPIVLGGRAQAAAGVPQPVPERARRDAEGRVALDHDARRGRPGGRRGRRHRRRHPDRAPLAHLRPVLHDEADRPGDGAGPVDHLRHRPRARRRHHLREHGRQGHGVHA